MMSVLSAPDTGRRIVPENPKGPDWVLGLEFVGPRLHVATALAAVGTAFAALFTDEAAAKSGQACAQAAPILLLFHNDLLRLLILHAALRWPIPLRRISLRWISLWRTAIALLWVLGTTLLVVSVGRHS